MAAPQHRVGSQLALESVLPHRKVTVVPFEPAHRAGMIALWQRHFGAWTAERFDRRWDWQFNTNPFKNDREPGLFVAVREGTQDVVGAMTATPVPLRYEGSVRTSLCGGALAVDEPYRGRCMDLARLLVKSSPAIAGGLHPSVRTIVKHFGFAYVPGSTRRFVLWLRHDGSRARQLRRHLRRSMTALATPRLVSLLPKNLFGRALPKTSALPSTQVRADIRPIDRFGADYDALWQRASASISCTIERSSTYMNWRHVDCPTQTSIRLGLYENGVLKAIAIGANRIEHDWTLTPCVMQGEITELIADEPGSPGVEALVVELVRRIDARRCDTIGTLGLRPEYHALLRRLGFADSTDESFAMVANPFKERVRNLDLKTEEQWLISAADSDALYGETI